MLLTKLTEENKKNFLNLSLYLVKADEKFKNIEKKLIDSQCAEMGIDNNAYEPDCSYEDICEIINTSATNAEKKIMLIELISLALIDEDFDEKEKQFIEKVRNLLGIPQETAEQAMSIVSNIINYTKSLENFIDW